MGIDEDYKEQVCEECSLEGYDVGCLCAKVPNFMGETHRFCRVNPHNAVKEGCSQQDYFQGLLVDHCFCREPLCNAGLALQSPLFVIIFLLIINCNIIFYLL